MQTFKKSIPFFFSFSLIITPALGTEIEVESDAEDEALAYSISPPVLRRTLGTHKYLHILNDFMETHELNNLEDAESYESTLHHFLSGGIKKPTLEDVKAHIALAKKPNEQTELFESILKRESDL